MNSQKYRIQLILLSLSTILCCFPAFADKCTSVLLLDGSEKVVNMGIDTTGHSWVLTNPYSRRYRFVIDGEKGPDYDSVQSIEFCADGSRYAYFGQKNGQWFLHTSDSIVSLGASLPGQILFSRLGALSYSYFIGNTEYLALENDEGSFSTQQLFYRKGRYFISNDGNHIAYASARGNTLVVIVDDYESDRFQDCAIAGFLYDNSIIYAGFLGQSWRLMRSNQEIATMQQIRDVQINQAGTVYACIQSIGNTSTAYLYSDEFIQPFISSQYDNISNLILHPIESLMAFNASRNAVQMIVMNSAEYDAGLQSGKPRFTHDGAEVFFCGDNQQDQFISINGQKLIQKNGLLIDREYVMAPKTGTIAFATNTALVMQRLSDSFSFAGIMVDYTTPPIFNHRSGAYEALGYINNRVYRMSCAP